MLKITIPIRPVGKARPRFGGGHVYTPKLTKRAEKIIKEHARLAYRNPPTDKPVAVEVEAIFAPPVKWAKAIRALAADNSQPRPIKPDVDNITKLVLDALNGVLWVDDAQVVNLSVWKHYGPADCLIVRVYFQDPFDLAEE